MFNANKIVNSSFVFYNLRNGIYTLVNTAESHNLSSIDLPVFGTERDLDTQLPGIRIITGVGIGVGRGRNIFDVFCFQAFGRETGGCHRKIKNLGNRGAYGPFVADLVAFGYIVGSNTALTVGRTGQIIEPRFTGNGMGKFYRVANGIDIGMGGL